MESAIKTRKNNIFIQAILFGLMFGFLLQKAGVAKYHVLQGQLLFTDFTVMKVMLTAILVGMIGLYLLNRTAKIKLHIKPTKLVSNIAGGLIFGIGFALAGYCPGTGAAALGQGDIPALIFMSGLVVGSYLFAEGSGFIKKAIDPLGNKGKVTLQTVLRMNAEPFVVLFAIVIAGVLLVLNQMNF